MDYGFRYRNGIHAMPASFLDPAAVEAWDAWFRWREGNELRDVTIDATWSRVTGALASLERGMPARYEQGIGDEISSWRLLPDDRVLALAGAPGFSWPRNDVAAAVNLARCVSLPFTRKASLQTDLLAGTVDFALRMLDNMRRTAGDAQGTHLPPRLGIVGLADTLAMLGLDYTAPGGVEYAARISREFSTAILDSSMRLARERGAADAGWRSVGLQRAAELQATPDLARGIERHGLRFRALSALMPLPRLALVANNVSCAALPLRGERRVYVISTQTSERRVTASGFAPTLWRLLGARSGDTAFPYSTETEASPADVLRMRQAVQPWFDDPGRD